LWARELISDFRFLIADFSVVEFAIRLRAERATYLLRKKREAFARRAQVPRRQKLAPRDDKKCKLHHHQFSPSSRFQKSAISNLKSAILFYFAFARG